MADRQYTDDEIEMACAWSDYRADYGVSADERTRHREYEAFKAGWIAAHQPAGTDRGAMR